MRSLKRLRTGLSAFIALLWFTACTEPGIDAGGEGQSENGGIGFMVMTVMLVLIVLVLWWILGREE